MSMIGGGFWGLPGITAALENTENIIWWGRYQWQRLRSDAIYSTSVDAGADPTTLLRSGLIMGKATSGAAAGMIKPWSPFATDGSQFIYGVLHVDQSMLSGSGSSVESKWYGYCFVGGTLKAKSLLIAKGSNSFGLAGTAEEFFVRQQLTATGRFQLDDQIQGSTNGWLAYQHASLQTNPAAITLTSAQNNTLCIANHSALTAYTLPSVTSTGIGMKFGFVALTNTGFSVSSSPADRLVWYNDAAADTVTYDSTGTTIGTILVAECIPSDPTDSVYTPKWILYNMSAVTTAGAATIPDATTT